MQRRMQVARKLWLVGWLALALVVAAGLGGIQLAVAGTANPDPEPAIDPNVKVTYPPGPGWPPGWAEPAEPTEIPQADVDHYNYIRSFEGAGDLPSVSRCAFFGRFRCGRTSTRTTG